MSFNVVYSVHCVLYLAVLHLVGEDSDFDEVDGTSELPLQSSDRQQGRSVGRGTLKQATTQLMVPTPEAEV